MTLPAGQVSHCWEYQGGLRKTHYSHPQARVACDNAVYASRSPNRQQAASSLLQRACHGCVKDMEQRTRRPIQRGRRFQPIFQRTDFTVLNGSGGGIHTKNIRY